MNKERFDTLVRELEHDAITRPAGYKFKVFLLAILGNVYIGTILSIVLALFMVLVVSIFLLNALLLKLAIIIGFFLWKIVKSMWVKVDPPQGTVIKPQQCPALFSMIHDLQQKLKTSRFHHVLITPDFNASVIQSPRLGLFGWQQNYLLIGLPLMKALTTEQFRAVLAHEFGHLSKGHGKIANWIYRQRLRWSRLLHSLESSESRGGFLFMPFLNSFVPFFNAYTFPLARANEYEADGVSAALTSTQTAAEALTSLDVIGSFLAERYWADIYKRADKEPQPGYAPYHLIGDRIAVDIDMESAQGWLDQAIARKTDTDDTHPSLSDRLEALGEQARLSLPTREQTADQLLGGMLQEITDTFDLEWKNRVLPAWEQRYQEFQQGQQRLSALNKQLEAGQTLTDEEVYERALLTESIAEDAKSAIDQLSVAHERSPENPYICFALGARLLQRNDDSGCALIKKAMQLDGNATARGCELLRDYYWRNENEEAARHWHQQLTNEWAVQEAAAKERSRITLKDRFERHALPEEQLTELKAALRAVPGLHKAYLVKKQVKHLADKPCYILGYKAIKWYQLHSKRKVEEVFRRIQEDVPVPIDMQIINLDGENYRFGRKFHWMRGTRVV
jgi:Zn-dependent protease with chaperone function